MVSVYPLLLFGGGHIAVDLSRGNFILSVDDGWIRFMADSHQVSFIRATLQEMLSVNMRDVTIHQIMDIEEGS